MQFIIIAIAGFLIWKNWDKIKGLFSSNIASASPVPPQQVRPLRTPEEMQMDDMDVYKRAGRIAMYTLRDRHPDEFETYVQEYLDSHTQ